MKRSSGLWLLVVVVLLVGVAATFRANAQPTPTLEQRVKDLERRLQFTEDHRVKDLDSSVVAFALQNCPAGWTEYAPAYGRFVRGIDKSDTRTDPDGTRTPGTLQADAFARHKHGRPNDVYDAGKITTGAVNKGSFYAYGFGSDRTTDDAGGAEETRPRNVALLYCTPK